MWIKDRHSRPSAADTAQRLIVLKQIAASAIATPPAGMLRLLTASWSPADRDDFVRHAEEMRENFWRGLREAGLWEQLSPRERAYANCSMHAVSQEELANASWRIEAIQVFLWALGTLKVVPPYDVMADHALLKQIPSDDVRSFIRAACLRERAEIERARDTAELWHWRSRTRQLIESGEVLHPNEKMKAAGIRTFDHIVRDSARWAAEEGMIPSAIEEDFPVNGKAYRDLTAKEWSEVRSITMERHYALNWLCGDAPGNRWDETPTDT